MLEKVATKCEKHNYDQMGKALGVLGNSLNQRVFRTKVVFTNENDDSEKSYFSQYTDICQSPDIKITKEII